MERSVSNVIQLRKNIVVEVKLANSAGVKANTHKLDTGQINYTKHRRHRHDMIDCLTDPSDQFRIPIQASSVTCHLGFGKEVSPTELERGLPSRCSKLNKLKLLVFCPRS